ncbi:MAG: DUF6691 family protein [Candidatus Sericytochromatia bacterium]
MNRSLIAFLAGSLFALGLAISGMVQPQKIVAFLDVFGKWDPTLMFVMVGAIGVHFVALRLIFKRSGPLLSKQFHLPANKSLSLPLVLGAALFGVGWGLGGYCPGPALTALPTAGINVWVLVAGMTAGILFYVLLQRNIRHLSTARPVSEDG